MAPEWMNWPIWNWISAAVSMGIGWVLRGEVERVKRRHEEIRRQLTEDSFD